MLKTLRSTNPWLIAILFHGIGAYYSTGYHHPDEHYQIWEWANYFIGNNPHRMNLPWEFGAEIRQWFQPMLHALFMQSFKWIGHYQPFTIATLARELYAAGNLFALFSLWKTFKTKYADSEFFNPTLCAWVIATLWFFPYIHCRTSSENLAGILLTFAFSFLLRARSPKVFPKYGWIKYLGIGVLFGLAFVARYQIALGMVGLGIYLLWQDRKIKLTHLILLIGFTLATLFGVILDRVGYGHWVLTLYRYFDVNLVKGVAANFNPYPWYQYFIWLIELNPFVSIPIVVGIYGYVKKVKVDALIAFSFAFFFLHCLMTNKEYRFIFPIFNFIPFWVAVGWKSIWPKSWALANIPAMMVASLRTTAWTIWPLFAFNHFTDPKLGLSQRWLTNHGSFDTPFYTYQQTNTVHYELFGNLTDLKPLYEKTEKPLWIVWDDHMNNATFEPVLEFLEQNCELKEISIPRVVFRWGKNIPAIQKLPYQTVYSCGNE